MEEPYSSDVGEVVMIAVEGKRPRSAMLMIGVLSTSTKSGV